MFTHFAKTSNTIENKPVIKFLFHFAGSNALPASKLSALLFLFGIHYLGKKTEMQVNEWVGRLPAGFADRMYSHSQHVNEYNFHSCSVLTLRNWIINAAFATPMFITD